MVADVARHLPEAPCKEPEDGGSAPLELTFLATFGLAFPQPHPAAFGFAFGLAFPAAFLSALLASFLFELLAPLDKSLFEHGDLPEVGEARRHCNSRQEPGDQLGEPTGEGPVQLGLVFLEEPVGQLGEEAREGFRLGLLQLEEGGHPVAGQGQRFDREAVLVDQEIGELGQVGLETRGDDVEQARQVERRGPRFGAVVEDDGQDHREAGREGEAALAGEVLQEEADVGEKPAPP